HVRTSPCGLFISICRSTLARVVAWESHLTVDNLVRQCLHTARGERLDGAHRAGLLRGRLPPGIGGTGRAPRDQRAAGRERGYGDRAGRRRRPRHLRHGRGSPPHVLRRRRAEAERVLRRALRHRDGGGQGAGRTPPRPVPSALDVSRSSDRSVSPRRVLAVLAASELCGMAPWFSASAVAPALSRVWRLDTAGAAWLTISVQLGFVAGALVS